jgi:hypothetical protein
MSYGYDDDIERMIAEAKARKEIIRACGKPGPQPEPQPLRWPVPRRAPRSWAIIPGKRRGRGVLKTYTLFGESPTGRFSTSPVDCARGKPYVVKVRATTIEQAYYLARNRRETGPHGVAGVLSATYNPDYYRDQCT